MPLATPDDARDSAEAAGLVHVNDAQRGLRREPVAGGFRYLKANGDEVRDDATLARIRSLAIPPAWTDVWICARANGHLQATGRDARGRKQYRYHPDFRAVRESTKYDRMAEFAQGLPALRAAVAGHMALRGLPREKVLATVVHLLETTLIRVGNEDYARQNDSYGLTTLRNPHVEIEGSELRFRFQGKSGKTWRLRMKDRRVAKIVRACQELPGQDLFQYVDEAGELRSITSADVNAYLREVTGRDITAKDFRTWGGTVLAALALNDLPAPESAAAAARHIKAAITQVAARLGNTVTICRKCYVHPVLLTSYQQGALRLRLDQRAADASSLKPEEAAVLQLLKERVS